MVARPEWRHSANNLPDRTGSGARSYRSPGVHWEHKDQVGAADRSADGAGGSIRAGRQAFREWNGVGGPKPNALVLPQNDADTICQKIVAQD